MTDIDLSNLSAKKLRTMLEAAQQVKASCRALEKAGLNLVGECLKGQGDFYEFSHYPADDVYDADSKSQYYFHTHRGLSGEYGHFHIFLRAGGMPAMAKPITNTGKEPWPSGTDALSHLICISMNQEGYPIGLFTTNVNHWISAMFSLYSLEMIELIKLRDLKVKEWRVAHPSKDVFEDRKLEITSHKKINVDQKINDIKQALK